MQKNAVRILLTFVVIVTSFVLVASIACFLPSTPKKVFEESLQSVVEIKAYSKEFGESYGTAVFVNEDGTLISNSHVVTYQRMGEANVFDEYSIRFASEEAYNKVELLKYDLEKDIAVLKIVDTSLSFSPIKIGNSDRLSFGETVYAIGNGSNFGLSITHGIVSIPKVVINYEGIQREVIQSDITISAGNSGGALLDNKGKLIGITSFRTKDNQGNVVYGLVYSIPINTVMQYLED